MWRVGGREKLEYSSLSLSALRNVTCRSPAWLQGSSAILASLPVSLAPGLQHDVCPCPSSLEVEAVSWAVSIYPLWPLRSYITYITYTLSPLNLLAVKTLKGLLFSGLNIDKYSPLKLDCAHLTVEHPNPSSMFRQG